MSLIVAPMAPAAPMVTRPYEYLAVRHVEASDKTIVVARSSDEEVTRARKPNCPYVFCRALRKHDAAEFGVSGLSPLVRARPLG